MGANALKISPKVRPIIFFLSLTKTEKRGPLNRFCNQSYKEDQHVVSEVTDSQILFDPIKTELMDLFSGISFLTDGASGEGGRAFEANTS